MLLKILDQEIAASECKCFTGRLSGFFDDIEINITKNEQIGAVISNICNNYKGNDIEELKNIIRTELQSRNIDNIIVDEWLEHVIL